jgi:dolichyl-phosphate-mannose-protein mannosyltransferase
MSKDSALGSIRIPLMLLASAALLAGLYGRFKGLGTWPLGVDEFYITRSIDNILRTGSPEFSCGGYYIRGLVYQYLVAGVRLTGLTPEFAGRFVAAICSAATLPAAYLLGKRIMGPVTGWLTVIILSVSIWEIEMARFARMYAPFQAVFVWYLVFCLRYSIDKERGALGWMIALSLLGVLTWEGGVLLGVANIVAVLLAHEHGRLKPAECKRLAALVLLLGLLYVAGTNDLRGGAEVADAQAAAASGPANQAVHLVATGVAALRQHLAWSCGWLLMFGLACLSLPWIWSLRRRSLAALSLCAALAAAAAHLFTLAAGIIALSLLTQLIAPRELTERRARYFQMSLASYFVFWLAFYHWSGVAASEPMVGGGAAMPPLVQHLFGFPDVYDAMVRPWGRTVPLLSIVLGFALIFMFGQSLAKRGDHPGPIAVLLTLILVMVLIIGVTPTGRIETRYTFFLYPVFIILAVAASTIAMQRLKFLRGASLVSSAAIPLLCFGATEDFQPRHLIAVDSAEVNFRVGMSASRAAHYYPRNDMRAVGEWLAAQVRPGDVVITGIPNLDEYYNGFDYFFLDAADNRYDAYVCRDHRTERWTNHPLLTTEAALQPIVAAGHRVFATLYPDVEERLRSAARLANWSVTRVWTTRYGDTDILLIAQRAAAAP